MLATSGWRANLAIVLSMGLRPCTGAILVLVLAFALDMLWVGVFSVMAMSLSIRIGAQYHANRGRPDETCRPVGR